MSQPLLSVCLITYNHAEYIREAIDSVLMQKVNFSWELIIADDFSIDGTRKILQEYKNKYPDFIKLILQDKNVGPAQNWMDLIKAPNSKYIAYFEGDDYWTDPLKLQKQVDFLENNSEYSMVCHDAHVINEMTNVSTLFFTSIHKKQICSTKDVFGMHFCPTASIVYRKQSLILSDFYAEAMAGDLMLVLLLSSKGLLYRMNDIMSVYRKTSTGMTEANRKMGEKSLINRIDLLNHFDKISGFKYKKYIRIEILLMKSTISFSKAKSKYKQLILMIYKKILSDRRRIIFNN